MRSSENAYNPYNAELLAILRSLTHFENIIQGTDVTVFSDHKPLVLEDQRTTKTMSHLSFKIQEFEAKLRFVKGSENTFADFVSRHAAVEDQGTVSETAPAKNWQNTHISKWGLAKAKTPVAAKKKASTAEAEMAAAAALTWTHPT